MMMRENGIAHWAKIVVAQLMTELMELSMDLEEQSERLLEP